jgi:hypothetical protein
MENRMLRFVMLARDVAPRAVMDAAGRSRAGLEG